MVLSFNKGRGALVLFLGNQVKLIREKISEAQVNSLNACKILSVAQQNFESAKIQGKKTIHQTNLDIKKLKQQKLAEFEEHLGKQRVMLENSLTQDTQQAIQDMQEELVDTAHQLVIEYLKGSHVVVPNTKALIERFLP